MILAELWRLSGDLIHFVAVNHYLALFLLILIEEAGCPLPLPGESLIVFAGSRIARGQMKTSLVFLSVLPASAIGCSLLYLLARTGGRALIHRFGDRIHLREHQVDRLEQKVKRIGPIAVLFGRLTPGIRVPTDIAAGIFRIPFRYYLPFALIATSIRLAFFLYIGASAEHLRSMIRFTTEAKMATTAVVLVAVAAGFVIWRRFRNRRAATAQAATQLRDLGAQSGAA